MITLLSFLTGFLTAQLFIIGLVFIRFWTKTKDRLFLIFAGAFMSMCLERIILMFITAPNVDQKAIIYLIRLGASLMIIYAILDKNRSVLKNETRNKIS